MFTNLFKKQTAKTTDTSPKFSSELKKNEASTLQLITHNLYMHYWSDGLVDNPSDPGWQNQAVFFWNNDTAFEQQSLPPNFRELTRRTFIIHGVPQGLNIYGETAAPWFGMPGGGTKYFFNNEQGLIPCCRAFN